MNLLRVSFGAIVLLLAGVCSATAQYLPNFSGRWESSGSNRFSGQLEIVQDGERLSVTNVERGWTLTYLLDGSLSLNQYPTTRGVRQEESRAEWIGPALVVRSRAPGRDADSNTFALLHSFFFDKAGNLNILTLDGLKEPVMPPAAGASIAKYVRQDQ
jgi:hypothetical protein